MSDPDGPTADPPGAPHPTLTYPHPTAPVATLTLPPCSVPFTDLTPHARGGLGEVFRGTDPDLHRTVAVKYLQDRHARNADSRRRFLLEAEITARLEHPGVVPVYGLYAGGDQPAYAMRFVEGQTLAEAITAYHAGQPDPVAFRRLLQSFLQVCQTVAYAHSRGVIHRDLKPANVMLGLFGVTLVVDWGLAKVVGRPEDIRATGVGETLVPSEADSGTGETAMGSAVGTPAYMSPEQAAGRWDVVTQPADIYSLGAVLYTVLTGRPPLEKGNWPAIQQKIQRGDFPRPRQVKPDVSRPLEAICLKAMALDPPARYTSAEALAADIEHWMADEPVAACRQPIAARVRRWAKGHRTLVSGATALLVASVVGLSVGAILLQRARVETEMQRAGAVTAQKKAEAINRFLIDDLLKQADPVNNPVGDKITVRELLDKASARLDAEADLGDQPEVEAELRAVIGHAYEYLDVLDKAQRHYQRAWDLRARLLGSDHPDTLAVRNRYVCAVVTSGQTQGIETLAQETLGACTRVFGDDHPETAEAVNNLAELRLNQRQFDESIALRRRASDIAHRGSGPDANKTLEYDNNLSVTLVVAGRPEQGAALLQSVVDRRRKLNPRHPELARASVNLGGTLIALGRFAEAEPLLRESLALQIHIAGPDSGGAMSARNLLAFASEGRSQWDEAEVAYLAVLADRRRVFGPASGDSQKTLAFIVRLYAKKQDWATAARYCADLILAQTPNPNRKPETLAAAIAAALDGTADPARAEPLLRECRAALAAQLWTGDWLLAEFASRYGDCLRRQARYDTARPILEEAAADVRKAVAVPSWGVAASRKRVADLYEAWNRPTEAAKWK